MKLLKKLRINRELTQEQVAVLVGLKRSTITSIELGNTLPSVKTAKKLGQLFKVDWKEFYD